MKSILTSLLIALLLASSLISYSQGQFPITADIGYAATMSEVSKHISVPGYTANSPGDPYVYQTASGSYSIYYATGNNSGTIRRPIIIVEGFDPLDQYSTDDVITLLNGNPQNANDNVAISLRAQGYDLIVLDYNDGGQLIQRNAFLLVKLIQHINAVKTTPCPIILAGFSMGGIVARYALNYMESQSSQNPAFVHNVGLYFSFDAPQKGANIPLGMQDLINWLDGTVIYTQSADIRGLARSIHSYAAQQMLIYHTDNVVVGSSPAVNSRFTGFYQQMKNLVGGDGYPRYCKKIAASLGNWTGLGQAYMNSANQWVDHTGVQLQDNPTAFSFSLNNNSPFVGYGIAGIGCPLPYNIAVPPSNLPWLVMYISVNSALFTNSHSTGYRNAAIPADVMPGSFTPIFEEIAVTLNGAGANSNLRMNNACFIPTVSALDFDTDNWYHNIANDPNRLSKTPFASIFATVGNRDHNIPLFDNNGHAAWILNEVAIFNAAIQCTATTACYELRMASNQERVTNLNGILKMDPQNNTNSQIWKLETSGAFYKIVAQDGTNRVIGVANGGSSDDNELTLQTFTGGNHQLWSKVLVDDGNPGNKFGFVRRGSSKIINSNINWGNGDPNPAVIDLRLAPIVSLPVYGSNKFFLDAKACPALRPASNDATTLGGQFSNEQQLALSVAPNPSSGIFKVAFYLPPGENAVLSVINVAGKHLLKTQVAGNGNHNEQINLEKFGTGTYLLEMRKGNGEALNKVIVVNMR